MATRRRQQFVHGQLAWMVGTVLALALLDVLSLSLFFVISLVGFLAALELTAPFNVTPRWRARLRWIVLLGFLGFAYLGVMRILEVLPGVF